MAIQTTTLPVKVGKKTVLVQLSQPAEIQPAQVSHGLFEEDDASAPTPSIIPNFDEVTSGIEAMSRSLIGVFQKVRPDKVSVEFNVGINFVAGKLVALFFDSKVTGGVKVTMQWGKEDGGEQDGGGDEDEEEDDGAPDDQEKKDVQ